MYYSPYNGDNLQEILSDKKSDKERYETQEETRCRERHHREEGRFGYKNDPKSGARQETCCGQVELEDISGSQQGLRQRNVGNHQDRYQNKNRQVPHT